MRLPRQEPATSTPPAILPQKSRNPGRLAILALVLLALGSALTGWMVRREDQWMREDLLEQTRRVAQTLPLDRLRVLHGNRSDEARPEYRRLKEQLMAAQQIDPDWEWIYLMGRRSDGIVFFQMDSEAYDVPDPSPSGQLYAEASPVLHAVFDQRVAATEGPVPDRWGVWVSAFVPLVDPKTNRLITVVGIDVEASRWRWLSIRAGLLPAGSTFLLLFLLFSGHWLGIRRDTLVGPRRRAWRYLEAILCVCAGLILTLTSAWMARKIETRHRMEAFDALAQIKSERILDAFQSLRHSEIEGLARFIEGSEEVTPREFRRYARHLVHVPEVVAWSWVPAVEATNRDAFEASVREGGWQKPEYRIWETDAASQRIPAAERPVHYPIYYVEASGSLAKYGLTPGRDLAATPAIRGLLEQAEQDGLICATDVLSPLPGATGERSLILVFRPVRKILGRGLPKGFAMAALDPSALLRSFLGESAEENRHVAMSLLQLRPEKPPQRIASLAAPDVPGNVPALLTDDWTFTRPIVVFGKTYAVAVRPGRAFVALHTYHLAWMVLLAGLSITLASSVLLNFIVHRREDLARLLDERGRELDATMHRYQLLSRQNRASTWEVDREGLYTGLGELAESLLGYPPEDLIGKKHFYDLHPAEGREQIRATFEAFVQKGEAFSNLIHPVVLQTGETAWFSTAGIPMRDEQGRVTGYWGTSTDVTERKRAEQYREMGVRALHVLNGNAPLDELLQQLTDMLRAESGFDAVGIRLQRGDQFPYVAQSGFSDDFIREENDLLVRDASGNPLLDAEGRLRLRCTCGLVLSTPPGGRTALTSDGGTCRLNDSSRLLELTPDRDPRTQPRNRCVHDGYGSIAWVPIRIQNRTVGLLQFNARRKGRLPRDLVHDLEALAAHVGEAMGRKQAEEDLRRMARENQEAARRFSALVQSSNTGAWEYDDASRRMWCSPEYFSMLGYDPREFDFPPERQTLQALWLDLIHPADQRAAADYLAGYLLDPRRPYEHRFRMRRKDGQWAWIWSRGQMLFDPDGRPSAKMVGTHIDVTERTRAEEALRESEQKYRMLTESMKDVVWIVDVETLRFLYVSPSVQALRGYAPEEVQRGTLADALAPGQSEGLTRFIQEHADGFRRGEVSPDTFYTLELRQPRKDGSAIDTEAIVRFWRNGQTGRIELHGVTRDVTERKRAEEDYRTLFQNMLEGFALHEIVCNDQGEAVDYRFLAVNPAFERLTGLRGADILGKTALEVLPDLERSWIETYGNVVLTGLPAFFNNYSAELGRHFEVTAFRSGPGQFACIFTDVTERQLAEKELLESRRRYAALLANLPGMAYRCQNDRNWTMEFVSQGCMALTGYAPEDLVGNRTVAYGDVIRPPYREAVWNAWQQVLREHGVFEMEYEIATRSGETKWVWEQGEGVYDDQGQVVGLEGFISDVTGRKLAEAERERLMRAIEQSGETILITDANGSILYVNPAFTQSTGYSREEVLGRNPRILSSGTHDAAFYAKMWKTLRAGNTWEGQIVNKRKDGTLFTEQAAVSPVRDLSGRIVNFVAVKRDITDRLRAEEENRALQAQLAHSQKLDTVGRLAGGVAHDFNNMLQAILGYAEMALEQVSPDQPVRADLLEIQKAAQRSAALTRQLQTFARKQVALPQTLVLNEAVEGTFTMLRRLIGEGIRLVWKPGPEPGLVRIDPGQLDQVVANLCINARDAVGKSGLIEIATAAVELDSADARRLGDLAPGDYLLLSVRDNGCGMPPDVLEHVFEPFFTTKPIGKGTGLGLSTVYGIVKQNQGAIAVESRPGEGSVFRIYLPRQAGQPAAAPRTAEVEPGEPVEAPSQSILLVEDEDTILRTTRRILESLGYRVLATTSAQEALRLFEADPAAIDLLITDVIMPEMNGPELVRRILAVRPGCRHLFISGYAANLLAEHGVKENHVEFIQKPFSRHALAKKVQEALSRK